MTRKDYTVALGPGGSGVDDPDQQFYQNYACGSALNYTGYCNRAMEQLFDRQSMEADQEKRKKLVWEIDQKLQEDGARPIIFYDSRGDLLSALGQGADDHGQQHLQRLADGRRLARPLITASETAIAADPRSAADDALDCDFGC